MSFSFLMSLWNPANPFRYSETSSCSYRSLQVCCVCFCAEGLLGWHVDADGVIKGFRVWRRSLMFTCSHQRLFFQHHIYAQPVCGSLYDWCSSTLTGMSTAGYLNSLDWMSERQTSVYEVKTKLWNWERKERWSSSIFPAEDPGAKNLTFVWFSSCLPPKHTRCQWSAQDVVC